MSGAYGYGEEPHDGEAPDRHGSAGDHLTWRTMNAAHVLLLLAAGLAAGTVNAVAGGGSLITFPALLSTGLGQIAANVTNSVAVSPGYAASVYGSRQDLTA